MEFIRPFHNLNQVEQWKLSRNPLDVAAAVRDTYAAAGPDAIAGVEGEVERLKWVGIYPQKQGGDAFMMRVKIPAGRLQAAQARRIGEVVDRFAVAPEPSPVWGDRYCDITTRQDIQLHWVHIGDVPEIWRLLEEVGITTVQACGDSARNVLSCPVSGVDRDEVLDASGIAREVSEFFTGNREYANLPRKFKMSITGCREDCAQAEINDIGLWPALGPEGSIGFNVLVGGGLSDGPRMASDLDVFVATGPGRRAVPGDRPALRRARQPGEPWHEPHALPRPGTDPEGFRAELATRAGFELVPAGDDLTRRYRGDHVGVHAEHREGHSYVGCSVPSGASPARSSSKRPASPRPTAMARSASPRTRTSCSPVCPTPESMPSSKKPSSNTTHPSPPPSSGEWWRAREVSSAASRSSRQRRGRWVGSGARPAFCRAGSEAGRGARPP